jgi:hypothetical protein
MAKTKQAAKKAKGQAQGKLPALAKGEIYRGITLDEGRLAHLIELPGEFTGTHAACTEWAASQGGVLPSRIDGIVLFDGKCGWSGWHWLAPQHAGNGDYAWNQDFGYGYQDWVRKSTDYQARAVRRVPVQ